MGYPPPPPGSGPPGGYGPPPGAPPPGGYGPPPGAPGPGGQAPYGGGYRPAPPPKKGNGPLIAALGAIAVVFVLALTLIIVLVTRDGGDGEVALTGRERRATLLDEDDIGGSFVEAPDDGDDEDDLDPDDIDASEECLAVIEELEEAGSGITGGNDDGESREFQDDEFAQLEISVSPPGDVGLDEIREFADLCPEFDVDDGELAATVEVSIVDDAVEVGDDRLTLELAFTIDQFGTEIELKFLSLYWTRAGNRASVTVSGAGDEATQTFDDPDEDLLADVAEQLDANLQDAIDEAR